MNYQYYPGCSLEGTAHEYDISTRAFMNLMGAKLIEIKDWVCCGASAAQAVNNLLSFALPAINLALAEKSNHDILAPCSACYLNLKKTKETVKKDTDLSARIDLILEEKNLVYTGLANVRHLLDVIALDMGSGMIGPKVVRPLDGLRVAPYYGCQCLRPWPMFDDPEKPCSMEPLIEAVGAKIHSWDMGGKCCGASHMNTKMEVGMELCARILKSAKGADVLVTVCPMCQMNLEGFQEKISSVYQEDLTITILYLPQLLGLAMGLTEKELGFDLNLSVKESFYRKL